MDFVFACFLALAGIISLSHSMNKENYKKLVEKKNREFADKTMKSIRIGGFLLLLFSFIQVAFIFF